MRLQFLQGITRFFKRKPQVPTQKPQRVEEPPDPYHRPRLFGRQKPSIRAGTVRDGKRIRFVSANKIRGGTFKPIDNFWKNKRGD